MFFLLPSNLFCFVSLVWNIYYLIIDNCVYTWCIMQKRVSQQEILAQY